MKYHTFDISITSSGTTQEYHLFARSTTQGEAKASTTIDPKSPTLKKLLKKLNAQTISDEELKSLGTALYQCLFVDKINMLFNRAFGETLVSDDIGLRLRLTIEAPELNILLWELLYSPDQQLFLAASVETPLSRYLSIPTPIRRMAAPKQVRILAVIPVSSGLNTEPEKQILREVESKLKPKIKVDFLDGPATPEAIRTALRNNEYHILHYAGHGLFEDEQGFMLLDYDEDSSERMTAERFAHYFLDYPSIRLVVLNACHGATRSAHQVLVGMAPQLVLRGVPAVIAMQDTIRDPDAVLFATEFYSELCHERQGGQVEVAVSRARKALLQSGSQINGFCLPVLYLRAQDGRLWDTKEPQKIETEKPLAIPKAEKKKSILENWVLRLTIIATLLGIFSAILDLPGKITSIFLSNKESQEAIETTYLAGRVTNMDGEGIEGAIITLDELPGDTTYTTSDGGFRIEKIPGKFRDQVRIYVHKDTYKDWNEYTVLPGPAKIRLKKE